MKKIVVVVVAVIACACIFTGCESLVESPEGTDATLAGGGTSGAPVTPRVRCPRPT